MYSDDPEKTERLETVEEDIGENLSSEEISLVEELFDDFYEQVHGLADKFCRDNVLRYTDDNLEWAARSIGEYVARRIEELQEYLPFEDSTTEMDTPLDNPDHGRSYLGFLAMRNGDHD